MYSEGVRGLLHSDNQNDVELGCWLSHRWRKAYLVWKSGLENAIILYLRLGVKAEEEEKRDIRVQRGGKLRREDEMPAWVSLILCATSGQ